MITKLTKEQEKQIPKYIEKFVKLAEKKTDRKKATLAVQNLYKSMGEKKPVVIFGKSPYATVVIAAMYKNLLKDDSQLNSQLCSQLRSQLYSQLDSQLYSQLDSQLNAQFYSQLRSQLRSQLDLQLYSQLCSQLYSQLDSQLNAQFSSQLDSQLSSQLDSQLSSQFRSQLNAQLYSQLRSQLYSQLNAQLYSQLDSQLSSQLDSQLSSQFRSQLNAQFSSQFRSQLKQINNNWYLLVWWLVWGCWYSFGKYIGVKFDNKLLKLFIDFVTNVSFIIPYKGFAFVSETPIKIHWKNNRLHNPNGMAVEYADGYGLYALHGVKFTKEQYEKALKADIEQILSWENIDQRSALLIDKPVSMLLEKVDKKLIEHTDECGGYDLYEINLDKIGRARILSYKGWSGGKPYAKFVPLNSEKCLDTVAKLRHQTVEEFKQSLKS